MEIFQNKFLRVVLALISLFILMSTIQNTYAKYVSSANAISQFTIAGWVIRINTQDIMANSNFTKVITPTFENNNYIKDGVIAPTAEGYFDLSIDSSDVDLSFNEEIKIEFADTNTVTDLVITKYKYDDDEEVIVNNNSLTISKDYDHTTNSGSHTYRIYVKWLEGEDTETMDNAKDTEATTEDGIAAFKVTTKYTQKK